MNPPFTPEFDRLFAQTSAEWPASLPAVVRFFDGEDGRTSYMVEGLVDLEDEIADRWIGSEAEVIVRHMHQAIAIRLHALAPEVKVLRPAALERRAVKAALDDLLGRLGAADAGWTAQDVYLIAQYFAINSVNAKAA